MNYAEIAYEAYAAGVGGQTFDGKPLPKYEALGARQQDGWACAAKAVRLAMPEPAPVLQEA